MRNNRPYHWLAEYYDLMFSDVRAPVAAAHLKIFDRILPRTVSACDLACGTGTTAIAFARRGLKTYAVDLSPQMCRAARRKMKAAGVLVRVLHADMRTFRLPETVDLVTCEFDALNHVERRSDLRLVAKSVARALNPGGHFFFDVNNRLGFDRYWTLTSYFEKPGVVLIMRNHHKPGTDHAWSDVDWFIRDRGQWHRRHERVDEVCWTGGEIRETLRAAGFDNVQAFDESKYFNGPLFPRGCRTMYLARKAA